MTFSINLKRKHFLLNVSNEAAQSVSERNHTVKKKDVWKFIRYDLAVILQSGTCDMIKSF